MAYDQHRHTLSTKTTTHRRPWATYLAVGLASCILTLAWVYPRDALPLVPATSFSQFSDLSARENVPTGIQPSVLDERDTNSDEAPSQALFKTNNLTDEVGWDEYSLFLRGQRIML